MGRHSKEIPADAPGRSLAEFMRQLRREAGLTWREIAEKAFVSHTMLSQNADGRLTPTWAPVANWFDGFYRATTSYGIEMTMSEEAATDQARKLWEACRKYQKEIKRQQVISAPPAQDAEQPPAGEPAAFVEATGIVKVTIPEPIALSLPLRERVWVGRWDQAPSWWRPLRPQPPLPQRHAPQSAQRIRPSAPALPGRATRSPITHRLTIQMPGQVIEENRKRAVPDSLYRVTCVGDVVAALNDALAGAGFDVSQLRRQGRLDAQVREVLTGKLAPTPGIIHRVIDLCGGTPRDHREWEAVTLPLLERMPARGRAAIPNNDSG